MKTYLSILNAAISSMVRGHHTPHCYSAHVIGQGYVNQGLDPTTRTDYLRQLERNAASELENLGHAVKYCEPGYDQPKRGILFANWNSFPSRIDGTLERAGYATEWSDEWAVCDDCNGAFRTEADSFYWKPVGKFTEAGEFLCNACRAIANHHAKLNV